MNPPIRSHKPASFLFRVTRWLPAASALSICMASATAQTATFLDSFPMPPPAADPNPSQPCGVAIDPSTGSVYVTDYEFTHARVVRFDATGNPNLTWGAQGTGNSLFKNPNAVAVNSATGRVFVEDPTNGYVQQFDTGGGWISTWSNPSGNVNGSFASAQALAIFRSTGDVYVSVPGYSLVQRITASGLYQGQWGSFGSAAGQLGFYGAYGMAIDQKTGQVYVTDPSNHRVQRFNSGGVFQAQWSITDTTAVPRAIATDAAGHLYIAMSGNTVRRYSTGGVLQLEFGSPGSGPGQFNTPAGIAITADGVAYITDQNNGRIQRWKITEPAPPQPFVTVAGKVKVTTTVPKAILKGTAGVVSGTLARVEVKVGKTAYKPASGAESWKFTAKLKPGKNVILVRAVATDGTPSTTKQIIVVRKAKR